MAQNSRPVSPAADPPHEERQSEAKVPLLARAPRLADVIAGEKGLALNAEIAAQMSHVEGFIQNSPADGKPPSQNTQVWMGRTAQALYFVFLCDDTKPGLIRTHLARRENLLKDDYVSVLLDPFQDHRRGVLFVVNPDGVQADAAWTENNSPDYSYDQVWDSSARITRQGWAALIAIPYRSLRFRPGSQPWGVLFQRTIPRNSEQDFWPRVAANISGTLTQEGTLLGIEGATGSHNIQLNPYAIAQNEHILQTTDAIDPHFSSRLLEGTAGGDAKIIVKDSIVIDATINPDFSQVESDQPQFTVNQRYPVYFPELRPFFLENASYFSTPINLLYTRNIVRPEYGVRATGKVGNTNLGLLEIDDRSPGESYAPGVPDYGKRSTYSVARVSQDFGKGSSLGAIYTDEEFAGSFNRVGGVDFTARFNDHWNALGQMIESSTLGLSSPGSPASYSAGPASYLEFTRNGHSFNFDNSAQDFSTGFITEPGFIQTADIRSNSNYSGYSWYPKNNPLQQIGVESQNKLAFDHQGNRVYHYTNFDVFFNLARKTTIAPIVGENSDTLTPAEYSVLTNNRNLTENYGGLILKSAPLPQVNFNILYTRGGNPNYYPVTGIKPFLLNENFMQSYVNIQPLRNLTTENIYLLDRNFSAGPGGAFVFENQTLRTKMNYQFTRAFSARVIVEYDSLLTNIAQTSLVRTKEVSTEALLTWLPHPGTAIYFGYNNDLQNFAHTLCTVGPNTTCDPSNPVIPRGTQYLNDGRQIFLKASYLFRF